MPRSRFVSVALAAAAALSGVPATVSLAAPAGPAVVTLGAPCTGSRAAVDEARRPAVCTTTPAGRRWIWSAPIPAVVAADAPVPGNWTAVTPSLDGLNADVPAVALPGAYASRAAMEERIVALVNEQRAARGLAPVTVDWRLTRLARWWAERHTDPAYAGRGTTHCPADRCGLLAAELGYLSFGEVIRPWSPFPTGDLAAERYFVDSPRHLAVLTQPRVTHIGMGVHIATGPDGRPASVTVVGQVGRARR